MPGPGRGTSGPGFLLPFCFPGRCGPAVTGQGFGTTCYTLAPAAALDTFTRRGRQSADR